MPNIIKANLDDMVFEDRERSYGAYALRKQYPKALFRASLAGILLFGLLAATPYVDQLLGEKKEEVEKRKPDGPITFLPPPPLNPETPPPPPPPLPASASTTQTGSV